MKFLVGKKEEMTQIFDDEGRVYPATILAVGPVVITQVKTKEKDGYSAIQVGYGSRKKKTFQNHNRDMSGSSGILLALLNSVFQMKNLM